MNNAINNVTAINDTRDTNQPPSWYFANHPYRTVREFKLFYIIGLPDIGETYAQVTTNIPWGDPSGGHVVQEAKLLERLFTRHGTTDIWTAWEEKESVTGAQSKANTAYNNSVAHTNSQITILSDRINLSATKEELNNIKIGGRNYLKPTTVIDAFGGLNVTFKPYGFDFAGNQNGEGTIRMSDVITEVGYWTVSGLFRGTQNISVGFEIDICDGALSDRFMSTTDNSWTKFSFTTYVPTVNSTYNFVDFSKFVWVFYEFKDIKIEKGNKATDWSPAPEDINNKINAIDSRLQTAELSIQPDAINATVKDQITKTVNDAVLANLWASGRELNPDPTFKEGFNGMSYYNNLGTPPFRWQHLPKSAFGEIFPTSSPYGVYFASTPDTPTSPDWGGFHFATQSRAKAKFLVRLVMAFEEGVMVHFHSNNIGDYATTRWLTPTVGKGINNFAEYIHYVECGATGIFSSTNFFAFSGGTTGVSVRIAFAGVYDITDAVEKVTKEQVMSSFNMTGNKITMFSKEIDLTGKITFSSLATDAQNSINTANNNASTALNTANTANNNAGTALSTANTANDNAGTALNTANSANDNAGTALNTANSANNTVNSWKVPNKTTIDGGKIETNSITADKINTNLLVAKQLKTSETNSRLSVNELGDNTIKIRHTNGQVGIELGLVGGLPKLVFYDSSGTKTWEGGMSGIVYVQNVPESWNPITYTFLNYSDSIIPDSNNNLTTSQLHDLRDLIHSQGFAVQYQGYVGIASGVVRYSYQAGINGTAEMNRVYEGIHTTQDKLTSNWIPNGWYAQSEIMVMELESDPIPKYGVGLEYFVNGKLVTTAFVDNITILG